jgi:hypothetical protein
MLETFGQPRDDVRPPGPPPAPAAPATPSDSPAEEVPFIEVGGTAASTDASASVRACMDRPPTLRLHAGPAAPSRPAARSVAFRPFAAVRRPSWPVPGEATGQEYTDLFNDLAGAESGGAWLFTPRSASSLVASAVLKLALAVGNSDRGDVVVLDAHWRAPLLAEKLGLAAVPGLRELLDGEIGLDEAVHATGHPAVKAVMAGLKVNRPSRPLGVAFAALLARLRERFAWIFVAAPALQPPTEAGALAPGCDAVYLVLDTKEADEPESADLARAIADQGSCVRGTVVVAAA